MNKKYKASIVINNYNYENYICDTITSALLQDYDNFNIIIVDDGSTDNSIKKIEATFSNHLKNNKIIMIKKKNGGQLSTFNAALPYIDGDYVFFLDADDLYENSYISNNLKIYQEDSKIDFIFCGLNMFRGSTDNIVKRVYPFNENTKIGYSYFSSLLGDEMPGIATSGISMKKTLLEKILPLNKIESDWKICADVCLKLGSSLAGGYKYYNSESKVLYRLHGKNNFSENPVVKSDQNKLIEYINTSILKKSLIEKNSLYIPNKMNDRFIGAILLEYSQRGDKSKGIYNKYKKIILNSNTSLYSKLRFLIKIKKIFRNEVDL